MKKTRVLWLSRDMGDVCINNRPNYSLWRRQPMINWLGIYHGEMILCFMVRDWPMFSDLRIRKGQCVKVVLKQGFKLERVK